MGDALEVFLLQGKARSLEDWEKYMGGGRRSGFSGFFLTKERDRAGVGGMCVHEDTVLALQEVFPVCLESVCVRTHGGSMEQRDTDIPSLTPFSKVP